MTRDKENSGAAFATAAVINERESKIVHAGRPGLSAREYTAIHTGTPDSGCDWIDEMIRKKVRREQATQIMAGWAAEGQLKIQLTEGGPFGLIARWSITAAEALIAELGGEG